MALKYQTVTVLFQNQPLADLIKNQNVGLQNQAIINKLVTELTNINHSMQVGEEIQVPVLLPFIYLFVRKPPNLQFGG